MAGLTTERLVFRHWTGRPLVVDGIPEQRRGYPLYAIHRGQRRELRFFHPAFDNRIARDGSCLNVVSERASNKPVGMTLVVFDAGS